MAYPANRINLWFFQHLQGLSMAYIKDPLLRHFFCGFSRQISIMPSLQLKGLWGSSQCNKIVGLILKGVSYSTRMRERWAADSHKKVTGIQLLDCMQSYIYDVTMTSLLIPVFFVRVPRVFLITTLISCKVKQGIIQICKIITPPLLKCPFVKYADFKKVATYLPRPSKQHSKMNWIIIHPKRSNRGPKGRESKTFEFIPLLKKFWPFYFLVFSCWWHWKKFIFAWYEKCNATSTTI